MALDVSLLSHFNLMDYSLLFVVAYNPEYVQHNKDDFEVDEKGELSKPYRLSKKKKEKVDN